MPGVIHATPRHVSASSKAQPDSISWDTGAQRQTPFRNHSGRAENRNEHFRTPHTSASVRISWARLLKRVFDIDIDIEDCPHCGGELKIIAAIEEPTVIAKILAHLGLPTRAPPRAPAQSFELFEMA